MLFKELKMSLFFPCKYKKLINLLKALGLDVKEGARHTRAECIHNGHKTTIPRHKDVKREVVKTICDFLLEKEFDEKEIEKKLK